MKTNLLPAIRLTLVCAVIFACIYPLMIYGIAQLAPNHGKGEIISHNGKTYYTNIAQSFTDDKYFSSRPSAAGYNAAGSSGSNKGPTNPDYLAQVKARIDTFLVHNPGITAGQIPSELVTASGSGLDPHLSVEAARVQVKRIAKQRSISEQQVESLIAEHTEKPLMGLFGTEKINVLKLNIALDNLAVAR